jgi:hypothetical protein
MRYKLKLKDGKEYTIDESAREALMHPDGPLIVTVIVTAWSGESKELDVSKTAVATMEPVVEGSGPSWETLKRKR